MINDISSRILYEDNHIIVVNKPAGILSQGDISGEDSLLDLVRDYVKIKYAKPGEAFIGLVHRLDRPVSGVMVFARTSKAASRLHREITTGSMEKYYIAVTGRGINAGPGWHRLENYLYRDRDITRVTDCEKSNAQKAVLYYTVLGNNGKRGLLLVKLDTGRKHQIRAQLSAMGIPVLGDIKYGSLEKRGGPVYLHSLFLSFNHPVSKNRMEFFCPPPDDFFLQTGYNPSLLREELVKKISTYNDHAFLSKTDPL